MINCKSKLLVTILFSIYSLNASAVFVDIVQSSLFLSVPGTTYQDDQLGYYDSFFAPKTNTFPGDFDISFDADDLTAENLGEMTWRITNNTGGPVSGVRIMGFLDAEVGTNHEWNEYGSLVGDVTNTYDSWEIDEPGYGLVFIGDIYDNLQAGSLDNTNGLPDVFAGEDDDASLALGFDIGDWMDGETIVARFLISGTLPGGAALAQHDDDTGDVFYFSGSVSAVPIPGSAALMLSGLALMAVTSFRRKKKQ